MPFGAHTLRMPSKTDALPGRGEPMPVPTSHFVNGARLVPPFPEGMEQALFGMGCFWGAERGFWQDAWDLLDRRRLCRWAHAPSDLRGDLQRPDRSRRGRLDRVQSHGGQLRRSAEAVLGGARSDPGDASRERCRHTVPVSHLLLRRRAAAEGPTRRNAPTVRSCARRATGPSRPRSVRRPSSTMPSTITSSTWPRTHRGTAASAEPG